MPLRSVPADDIHTCCRGGPRNARIIRGQRSAAWQRRRRWQHRGPSTRPSQQLSEASQPCTRESVPYQVILVGSRVLVIWGLYLAQPRLSNVPQPCMCESVPHQVGITWFTLVFRHRWPSQQLSKVRLRQATHKCSFQVTWVPINSRGFLSIHVGSFQFTWVPFSSRGLLSIRQF